MTGRFATLLECWDSKLLYQHCFGGKGVLKRDDYMVKNADIGRSVSRTFGIHSFIHSFIHSISFDQKILIYYISAHYECNLKK